MRRVPVGEELGQIDGLAVTLDSIELEGDATVLHLARRENAATARLDAAYEEAFLQWAEVVKDQKASGTRADPPPPQPGERMLGVSLVLHDDVGTDYAIALRWAGGSGTEWLAGWRFAPRVPAGATRLLVSAHTAHGSKELEIRLRPMSGEAQSGSETRP
jgi:hypothetical protein